VLAKFGSITDCNSPDFNGVDGIVGFGMPVFLELLVYEALSY
jgi:hypothetical protein